MQLLINDPTYADWEGDRDQFVREIEAELATLAPVTLERGDIGPGADWPMFLAIFSTIGAVFLLGERIDKSIDAWVSIGRKFVRLVANLRKKYGATRVDETGASLIALNHIADVERNVASVQTVAAETLPIHEFTGRDRGRLDSRYNALYVKAYVVNDERIYVLIIRGDGEIDAVKTYGTDFMTFGRSAG